MEEDKKKINWPKAKISISLPLLIFFLNLIIVAPLLQGEFSSLSSSEQPVFVKTIEFLKNSHLLILWTPFWQGGFSFPLFFTPVVPFIIQIISFFGLAVGQALRILGGLSYALIPLGLYFFVMMLTKRKIAGLIAAFFFSLHPSILGAFSSEVREASLSFFDAPWHFIISTFGNAPHVLSLAFIPITGAFFLYTLRKTNFKKVVICSALIALTALIDFVSFFSLLILLFVLMFSEILLTDKKAQSRLGIFFLCLFISFGFFSFWYNPSFIKNFFTTGPGLKFGADLLKIIPYLILSVPWVIIGVFYIFGYRKHLQSIFIALGWFTLTFILTFSYFFFGRSFVPQAQRYLVEMNMAFSIILGVLAAHFYDWLGRVGKEKHRFAEFFRHIFVFGVIIVIIFYSLPFIKNAWQYNQPEEDVSQQNIYKATEWLEGNIKKSDSRVFVSSPENHWFSLVSDRSQISNPLPQNQYQNQLIYHINRYFEGEERSKLLMLAQATNTEYFVFPEDFNQKEKFIEASKLIKKIDGIEIHKINLPNNSLVQKVDANKLTKLASIDQNFYLDDLRGYAAWQEEFKKKIDYEVVNNQKIKIQGELKEGEGYLVKMNYDPGFKARAGKENLEIRKDPMGFMVLLPKNEGKKIIELKQGLSLNQWIGIDLTLLTVFFLLLYRFKPNRKLKKRGKKEFNIQ